MKLEVLTVSWSGPRGIRLQPQQAFGSHKNLTDAARRYNTKEAGDCLGETVMIAESFTLFHLRAV